MPRKPLAQSRTRVMTPLQLSNRDRRLMASMGIQAPSHREPMDRNPYQDLEIIELRAKNRDLASQLENEQKLRAREDRAGRLLRWMVWGLLAALAVSITWGALHAIA